MRTLRYPLTYMHPCAHIALLFHLYNSVTIASFDDIVRVDTSTWLIANYIMCGIGDGA